MLRARTLLAVGLLLLTGTTAPASAATDPVAAASTTVVTSGDGGVRLHVPQRATLRRGALRVDLRGQPAAFVQVVPRRPCSIPGAPDSWCPIASVLAVAGAAFGDSQGAEFGDSNEGNLPPGPLDVYVLAPGPVRVHLDLEGLAGAPVTVDADRAVDGLLVEMPRNACTTSDCARTPAGSRVEDLGTRGSSMVHVYSRTSPHADPAGLTPNVLQSKGNVSCGYSEDLGGSVDPADHDGSCDLLPAPGSDDWRRNAVNYGANAHPVSGPLLGFASWQPSGTGRTYLGYRAHALSADDLVAPGRARATAWGAWLRAGFR